MNYFLGYVGRIRQLSGCITFIVGFILTMNFPSTGYSQAEQLSTEFRSNNKVLGCDESVALQDIIVTEALERLEEESVLLVIIRPSTSENNDLLSRRRLFNVQQYFRDRGSRLNMEKVLFALGTPVPGNSRLEYYINGKLSLRLIYPTKGYICHSCCGPDPAYYPYKKVTTIINEGSHNSITTKLSSDRATTCL